MKKGFIGSLLYKRAAWLAVLLMLGGMLFSRALLSIGMASIFIVAVLNKDLLLHLRIFFKNPVLWGLSLTFIPYLLSGLYSANMHSWGTSINTKLVFLLLPFGFIVLRNQSKSSFMWLLYFFLLFTAGTCAFVLMHYLRDFSYINLHYSAGTVMYTPYSHVRFSLLVCFAILTGGYLYWQNFHPFFKNERFFILALTVLLVVFIHVLAVRSGLVALYLCALYLIIRYVIVNKKWKLALPGLALIICLPLVAYWVLPSFRQKYNYVSYDLQSFLGQNKTQGLSDAARLMSLKNGLITGRENFWLGVGAGDLQDETDKAYVMHPEIDQAKRLPHNQFVWVFASTGFIGLIVFCWGIFLPFFYRRNYTIPLFTCLYIIVISSCLTEATMEEEIGSCLYLVFMLLLYNQFSVKND